MKDIILVTCYSFISLIVSFATYYLLFLILEFFFAQDKTYHFVSSLRLVYGILWAVLGILFYRLKKKELLKSGVLTGSFSTLLIVIGVLLHQYATIVYFIILFAVLVVAFLLIKCKYKWHHFYALLLAVVVILFYLS